MYSYEVRFSINGRAGGSIIVQAKDTGMARRLAQAQLSGNYVYAGKRISITSIRMI